MWRWSDMKATHSIVLVPERQRYFDAFLVLKWVHWSVILLQQTNCFQRRNVISAKSTPPDLKPNICHKISSFSHTHYNLTWPAIEHITKLYKLIKYHSVSAFWWGQKSRQKWPVQETTLVGTTTKITQLITFMFTQSVIWSLAVFVYVIWNQNRSVRCRARSDCIRYVLKNNKRTEQS